jgi:hypothetical protein
MVSCGEVVGLKPRPTESFAFNNPSLTLPLKREGEGTEITKTPAEAGVFSSMTESLSGSF